MSDIQLKGRQADYELKITAEAHAAHRVQMMDQAVALAALGKKDEAYTKLLMVVAIDGIRDIVRGHVDTATIERESEKALAEANTPAN